MIQLTEDTFLLTKGQNLQNLEFSHRVASQVKLNSEFWNCLTTFIALNPVFN